jgi:molybdopterin converting factor small subunit
VQVIVYVPAALRQFAAGARSVCVEVGEPATLADVFDSMHARTPGVVERTLDERGTVRPHVNVFVDGDSIRAGPHLGLQTPLVAGAEIWILPAVSGGAPRTGEG